MEKCTVLLWKVEHTAYLYLHILLRSRISYYSKQISAEFLFAFTLTFSLKKYLFFMLMNKLSAFFSLRAVYLFLKIASCLLNIVMQQRKVIYPIIFLNDLLGFSLNGFEDNLDFFTSCFNVIFRCNERVLSRTVVGFRNRHNSRKLLLQMFLRCF